MATVLLLEPHAESARIYAQSLTRAGFRVETITAEPARLDRAADLVVISNLVSNVRFCGSLSMAYPSRGSCCRRKRPMRSVPLSSVARQC